MTDLAALTARIATVLTRAGIGYMVIDGIANLVWGEPRTTTDVDVTVDVAPEAVAELVALTTEIGAPMVDDPVAFAKKTRVVPIRTRDGVRVDFILAAMSFELGAIERARPVEIGGAYVRVCAPEDLIVHKVVSERARDHEDIAGVIRRQASALDFGHLDVLIAGLASELGDPEVAQRYEEAKRLAGVRPDRGDRDSRP